MAPLRLERVTPQKVSVVYQNRKLPMLKNDNWRLEIIANIAKIKIEQ